VPANQYKSLRDWVIQKDLPRFIEQAKMFFTRASSDDLKEYRKFLDREFVPGKPRAEFPGSFFDAGLWQKHPTLNAYRTVTLGARFALLYWYYHDQKLSPLNLLSNDQGTQGKLLEDWVKKILFQLTETDEIERAYLLGDPERSVNLRLFSPITTAKLGKKDTLSNVWSVPCIYLPQSSTFPYWDVVLHHPPLLPHQPNHRLVFIQISINSVRAHDKAGGGYKIQKSFTSPVPTLGEVKDYFLKKELVPVEEAQKLTMMDIKNNFPEELTLCNNEAATVAV
jgi:hypothetical protein